ncbi:Bug family tripartite tricarboxylate transporter substrate binding protein [Paracraurococcus lichenis]|uniref:Tripartite tricarboxylate transporter substrate binding protein n=1 Tax=Paracraurococcus lichenis TaxID=3064888 RepID=A0ABT9EAF5_9PROT|nr:tripartite tricarboxylate transporter substrate binding protein [Paracraurococcus sp. LOR1-02]MDO9713185.1 tripartite tricarboxylate transporter substrate binding protein [Paracraurococcus sp. LOR1-02]
MLGSTVRRDFLSAAMQVPLLARAGVAHAEATWPNRPVRIIVPFPPGQSTDVLPRFVGDVLSRRVAQPVVFENRAGGVGVPGTEAVARATPDGHTLGVGAVSTLAVNPALMPNLPYDVERDLTPVAKLFDIALAVVVHPSVPATTLPELVTWLRGNPGTRYASAGPATTPHLAAALFARRLGILLEHVPYRGSGPAMADLVAGVVPVMFDTVTSALPQASAAKVRLLAVTTAQRLPRLPDIPTVSETVSAGFEVVGWGGLVAPAGTPAPLVETINGALEASLGDPLLANRFGELGAVPTPGTAGEFAAFVRAEAVRWGELVRTAGIRLDG